MQISPMLSHHKILKERARCFPVQGRQVFLQFLAQAGTLRHRARPASNHAQRNSRPAEKLGDLPCRLNRKVFGKYSMFFHEIQVADDEFVPKTHRPKKGRTACFFLGIRVYLIGS